MAQFNALTKGGTVMDGTRVPCYRADIGVKNGIKSSPRNILHYALLCVAVIAVLVVKQVEAAPVEWKVIDGGNGHFYELIPTVLTWTQAKAAAEALSFNGFTGHLATSTSQEENDFVFNILEDSGASAAWLGGFQPPGAGPEPAGGWTWVTTEPFIFTNWNVNEPANTPNDFGFEDHMAMNSSQSCNPQNPICGGTWFDINELSAQTYLVEFVSCVEPPAGLVSWWPGDGDATDIIGGNSPTLTLGAPQFVAAKVGQGIKFDGDDGFIVSDSPNLNFGADDSFTIDAWVRVDGHSSSKDEALIDKRGPATNQRGYILDVLQPSSIPAGTSIISFSIFEDNVISQPAVTTSVIEDGQFHFVAAVVDRFSQIMSIYLDGVLQDQANIASIGDLSNDKRLFIGHNTTDIFTNVKPFIGVLDEVEIFNRALSDQEVQDIFNAGSAGKCTSISVEIDIKPGSDPNCINLGSNGVIPVAILTTDSFDAATVDPFSVKLEGAAVKVKGKSGNAGSLEDVDGDIDLDLVVQVFNELTLAEGQDVATLTGNLLPEFGGTPIEGTDSICIVP